MRALPPNWVWARVGDLVEVGPKNQADDEIDAGFVPLQRMGINYRSRHSLEVRPWGTIKKGYTHFMDGDVLLARITPSFENGKGGIVRGLPNGIGSGSTEYYVCRPIRNALLPEYLLAHFKTPRFLRDGEQVMSGAVGQQRLPKQYLLDSQLPLPPLGEQKRITDKLDALLARVDACRERLDRVPAILKRFRQAVLAAAMSGELTAEWREGTSSGTEWRHSSVGALLVDIRYGTAKKCLYEPRTTPVLRIPNIIDGRVNHEDMKYAEFIDSEFHRLALLAGDILMIRSNGSLGLVGRTAIVSDREAGFVYAGYLIRLRVNQALAQPAYVSLALSSPKSRDAIELVARSTSGVNNINTDEIKALPIPLPGLEEQREIARRVEALLAYADRIEARYAAARAQVERLTPALLAKGFRGDLVPQDPNDEPASVLLQRICAARAANVAKPRRALQNRKEAMAPLTPEAIQSLVHQMPTDHFTFDDLRKQFPADYETLKNLLFTLLADSDSGFKQVFDSSAQAIHFLRTKP